MAEELKIIHWPDPRLLKVSKAVTEFTPDLRDLALRMLELMRQAKGVGLAAPQVGKNIRLFVMNPNGEPGNDRIYVNPILCEPQGEESADEGCLSLPEINAQINRNKAIRMQALDLEGKPFEQAESGFVARVWQHEFDHLNGVLITDRMGVMDKLKYRKALKELKEKYVAEHPQKQARQKAKVKRQK